MRALMLGDAVGVLIRLGGAVIVLAFLGLALSTVGELTRALWRPKCPECGLPHSYPPCGE